METRCSKCGHITSSTIESKREVSAKLREVIDGLNEVKGSPIKSWAAIGEDFEFWYHKNIDKLTAEADALEGK